jgi:hypothetical protein
MKTIQRIFSYPYEHYIASILIVIGFSMSVLIDKNQADNNFLNNVIYMIGLIASINVGQDILSFATKVGGFTRDLSSITRKHLIFNIIGCVIFYFSLSIWRGLYHDAYYHTAIGFIFSMFQVAAISTAFTSFCEIQARKKAKPE